MPSKSVKSADKQTILKKLVVEMKRRCGGSLPKQQRSIFEMLLFSICYEDAPRADAEAAYARLLESFFDMNEIRVSSVAEIEQTLRPLPDAAWKALRIREALQHIFEKHYAFDLEPLRRKTQEQAVKELSEIPHLTPFVRLHTVQQGLGAHLAPVDASVRRLLVWLALISPETSEDAAAEELKAAVKKADGPQVFFLLKSVASDAELQDALSEGPENGEVDPFDAPKRLAELFKNPRRKKPKAKSEPKEAKAVSHKKPEKKSPARAAAAPATRKSAKKVTKKRPEPKKSPRKRAK